jgi:hypothetical protein
VLKGIGRSGSFMPEWQMGMILLPVAQAAPISNCTHGRWMELSLQRTRTAAESAIARLIVSSHFSPP